MKFNKLLATFLLCVALPAHSLENIEINSFLSVAASSMSEEGRYLDKVTEQLSFENDSVYGVNIRTKVSAKVSGAAQLLATAQDSNFNLEVQWAYLSYKLNKEASLRTGMLNLSTFLISDYTNTGYLYPWIRTPIEVYDNNPLENFLGAEWLHIARFGKSKLTTQLFVGSAQVEKNGLLFRASDGYGFNLQYDAPHVTLRIGAISPTIQLEATDPSTGIVSDIVDLNDRGYMYTVGASVKLKNFIMYTEAVTTDTEGQSQSIFPNQTGMYLTLGYKVGKYLPHVTVASSEGDIYTGTLPTGIPAAAQPLTQDSITYGLRYNVDNNVAVKFEYQTVTLEAGQGDGFAVLDVNPNTGETFNVVTVAMDVIF